jgi:hypothetical protein
MFDLVLSNTDKANFVVQTHLFDSAPMVPISTVIKFSKRQLHQKKARLKKAGLVGTKKLSGICFAAQSSDHLAVKPRSWPTLSTPHC